ncbi:MAG: TetR/AcrR family transcriptional regulator [Planctomycetota bacterium]
MPASARKQREIAERERLILDTARRLLRERGYLGVNMDGIAAEIEYSKGTVYQHFTSKEDLIAALCTDTLTVRAEMFRRAVSFDGRPRERITAVGVADQLFVHLNPDHFAVESILDVGSVFGKVDEDRRDAFLRTKSDMMETLMAVVQDAIDRGDLTLDDGAALCQPLYGMWTQSVGHYQLEAGIPPPQFEGVPREQMLWRNYQKLLDGYGWAPLSSDWDYAASITRIRQEVFADEQARFDRTPA